MTPAQLHLAEANLLQVLNEIHSKNPTTAAHPREKVIQMAKLPFVGKPLDRVLATWSASGVLRVNGTQIASANFQIQLTPRQEELLSRVEDIASKSGINAPHPKEIGQVLGVPFQAIEEIIRLGVEADRFARVADGLHYPLDTLKQIKTTISELVNADPFTVADLRDRLGTSRKYLVPLLEYFDATGFTMRQGDRRVIR
jgi:selenocysteine-specific elongation factor